MLTQLVLILLICQKTVPHKIYMHDGRWLANDRPLTLDQGTLIYERNGQVYRLPPYAVDLTKTLGPKPKPAPKRPRRNAIPWSDPAFARKTHASKNIQLTDDGLFKFVEKHPYVPADSEDHKASSEGESASADTSSSLPDLNLDTDWHEKPSPRKAAKGKKAKHSKRKPKSTKKTAPPPEQHLDDPLWFDGPSNDEEEEPLEEQAESEAPS